MADFNNRWIEIFRAGDYGEKGKWGPGELDQAIASFKAGVWTPPAVLGHPETDSPALAWVEDLEREGDVLKAKFKQVQPELEAHVSSGRFPNRSAAFYLDPKSQGPVLRHVGFLGATPPEVKGLTPIEFSDGDYVAIDFNEEAQMDVNEVRKTVATEIRSFFSGMFAEKKNETPSFTEEQVQQRIEAATKPLTESMNALTKKFDESIQRAEQRVTASTDAEKRADVKTFVAKLKGANKWVPAFSEMGLESVLEDLAISGRKVKFGEAGKEKEFTSYETLATFLEKLPSIVPVADIAGKIRRVGKKSVLQFTESKGIALDEGSVGVRDRAIEIAEEKKIPFGEALRQARAEMGTAAASAGASTAGAV